MNAATVAENRAGERGRDGVPLVEPWKEIHGSASVAGTTVDNHSPTHVILLQSACAIRESILKAVGVA